MKKNVEKARQIVVHNCRIPVRELADELDISKGSARTIPLHAKKTYVNVHQMHVREHLCRENLKTLENDLELLKRVKTDEETWVYGFRSKMKAQSSEYRFKNEPRHKQMSRAKSLIKVLFNVSFDYRGIVHWEFMPPGSTVTKEYHLEVLRRLSKAVGKKLPHLWNNQ